MSKLTESAEGQECYLRIFPDCNGNPETTVLCHFNSPAKGWSQKSPDFFGAFGCSKCHDILDGRAKPSHPISPEEMEKIKLRALYFTWTFWLQEGYLTSV